MGKFKDRFKRGFIATLGEKQKITIYQDDYEDDLMIFTCKCTEKEYIDIRDYVGFKRLLIKDKVSVIYDKKVQVLNIYSQSNISGIVSYTIKIKEL